MHIFFLKVKKIKIENKTFSPKSSHFEIEVFNKDCSINHLTV